MPTLSRRHCINTATLLQHSSFSGFFFANLCHGYRKKKVVFFVFLVGCWQKKSCVILNRCFGRWRPASNAYRPVLATVRNLDTSRDATPDVWSTAVWPRLLRLCSVPAQVRHDRHLWRAVRRRRTQRRWHTRNARVWVRLRSHTGPRLKGE
ncbi:hypothetical protein LX36DRAFT_21631 [Colletotrichum falcatum]|nr:hypothetical protein LX36DRAFT_21631 [Colletotrichum falcatum]